MSLNSVHFKIVYSTLTFLYTVIKCILQSIVQMVRNTRIVPADYDLAVFTVDYSCYSLLLLRSITNTI